MVAKQSQRILTALAGTTALLAFLILSSVAVVWANGLRYNYSTGSFEQTVLIAIDSLPQDVEVWLNGRKITDRIPYRLRNLLPGYYKVELTKKGFNSWRESFWLSGGQVALITNPTLIALQPLVTTAEVPMTTSLLDGLDFGLQLSGGELTDNGELVTRFSQIPIQIHRFNELYLYQVGGELRLFVKAGAQDYLVYSSSSHGQQHDDHRLSTSDKLPLALYPALWQVAVKDGTLLKLISLTTPTP